MARRNWQEPAEATEEEWERRRVHRTNGYNAIIRSRHYVQVTLGRVQTFHFRSIQKTKQESCWPGAGVEIRMLGPQTNVYRITNIQIGSILRISMFTVI